MAWPDEDEGIRYCFGVAISNNTGNADIPDVLIQRSFDFMQLVYNRSAIGVERGGVRRVFNLQGVMEAALTTGGDLKKSQRFSREDATCVKMTVKHLQPSQTFEREFLSMYKLIRTSVYVSFRCFRVSSMFGLFVTLQFAMYYSRPSVFFPVSPQL